MAHRLDRPIARRQLLLGGARLAGGLAVGLGGMTVAGCTSTRSVVPIQPNGPEVEAAEAARRRAGTGRVVPRALTAARGEIDLGGVVVSTWLYDGVLPGPPIALDAGDELDVTFRNTLPEASSVHWHGIAIRNDMDGVPGLTQPMVMPGETFRYRFTAPDAGTYWAHAHSGMQVDRGLYLPLIVRARDERGRYDVEHTVVFDDWLDGTGTTPDAVLAALQGGHPVPMRGMDSTTHVSTADRRAAQRWVRDSPDASSPWGPMLGNVGHRLFLANGRLPSDAPSLVARPGQRVLLRLINAAADTAFRIRLAGHRFEVRAADGRDVQPVTADEVLLAMGERYDVVVDAGTGRWALTADAEGKHGSARAVLRTSPAAEVAESRSGGRLLAYPDLVPAGSGSGRRPVDRLLRLTLDQSDTGYVWTMNGRTWNDRQPLDVHLGERVRLVVDNDTDMFHPMHLHGHSWAMVREGGTAMRRARKDVTVVRPGSRLITEFDADNPGRWPLHCHNAYHGQSGMMTELRYVA